ncbi:MAG: diaminopimelate decarboxylase [Alphaproteobacteria bacterium]
MTRRPASKSTGAARAGGPAARAKKPARRKPTRAAKAPMRTMADADRIPGSDFAYRNGELHAEDIAVGRIAQAVGTPFYAYSTAALTRNYRDLASALSQLPATICYALKANSNLAVIRTFAELGAGADVVSEGELRKALAAGVPPERIVFSGVGKTRDEIAFALKVGIHQLNIESESELDALEQVAASLGIKAVAAVRVNPNVDAKTHHKISTGRKQDKFGIAVDRVESVFARAQAATHVSLNGLAVHIGSQILSLDPYRAAFTKLAALVKRLRRKGYTIDRLDLGGGLGITYKHEQPLAKEDYAALVAETLGGLGCKLMFEPGRALVGDAGILVTSALYVKDGGERPIVIVDAAMNDLKRPVMYGSYHVIVPALEPKADAPVFDVDVVGPICETGDTFAVKRPLPAVAPGNLLVMGTAGAYGAVMSSAYNSRLLIPEVLVDGDRFAVVRPRPSYDDMLRQDILPPWLSNAPAAGARTR